MGFFFYVLTALSLVIVGDFFLLIGTCKLLTNVSWLLLWVNEYKYVIVDKVVQVQCYYGYKCIAISSKFFYY